MILFRVCIVLVAFISGFSATGQVVGTSKSHSIRWVVDSCQVRLSDFTVVPSSLYIYVDSIQLSDYSLKNHTVVLSDSLCHRIKGQAMTIRYRTFGFNLETPFFTVDSSQLIHQELMTGVTYDYNPFSGKTPVIESPGLDYRGSFSRGLSVGNNQSLVPNSNFDMQLMGDLGNGLQVVAAISDDNLPIQAQGNTQQLQEFDKVFIQVQKDRHGVTAGDYELRRPDSYFMNYFKKLKGVSVSTHLDLNQKTELQTKGSFAISRGKFARQTLPTREGNQGPYRLTGNNNERFIIVLAGTEKVFFNGILLTRGFDYDYVIDYNKAEITFSPQRVIARDSRVIIEFEYTDIRYLRSLYATESVVTGKKWKAGFHFYSEQDSKTTTSDIPLDSTDIRIMALSGDDLEKSVRSGIRLLDPSMAQEQNRILYSGIPDPLDPSQIILKFTTNLDSARYSAIFSEVGQGKGDYIIDPNATANSRIYTYAGKNQGSYMPVIRLIPPEQRQMLTANARYDLSPNTYVFAETAMSYVDINRLSAMDNSDNAGVATHLDLGHRISLDTAGIWQVSGHLKYEYVHENFSALNPFRPPEFTRDWNVELLTQKGHEHLMTSLFQLIQKDGWKMKYGYKRFDKDRLYHGGKHEGIVEYQKNRWNLRAFTNILESESDFLDEKTVFLRPNGHLYYKLGKNKNWSAGYIWDAERNVVRGFQSDTLKSRSYEYAHHKWFLGTDENRDFSARIAYSVRDDYFSQRRELTLASRAYELEMAGKWTASPQSHLEWTMIGRELRVFEEDLLPNDRNQRTLLGRLDYNFSALNQGIRSTTSYNTYAGQEPRVEYVFQRVERGQGDYIYIGNSENPNLTIIQDFRYDPSNPLSDYIRLTLINNEFIRTNNIELNQNITFEPGKFLTGKERPRKSKTHKLLSKFSTLSTMRLTKKQMDNTAVPVMSFVDFSLNDTSLVAYTSLNNHTFFFNRGNVKYDIQAGRRSQKNRVVQISGREDRGLNEWFFKSRWNMFTRVDLFINLEQNVKTYASEILPDRNLDILSVVFRPELSIRPTQNSRIILKYARQNKSQRILLSETARLSEFILETSIRKVNKYSVDAQLSFVNIRFSGLPNSPIEYDMLNGLKNGQNYLWNLVYTKRISKNLDLTVNYEGRKTGLLNAIHVGRAQIKATF
jgi:hypothetical protein